MSNFKTLNYVLISDGSSDKALLSIIDFTLARFHPDTIFSGDRAELSFFNPQPKTLVEKINNTLFYYEPDIIFIHRDAEKETLQQRDLEIQNAIENVQNFTYIKIIPIRMTEAWLLTNESAIRIAAENPNGRVKLALPQISKIESLSDPKQTLRNLIIEASELKGRRLQKLKRSLSAAIHLVAEHTEDFSKLDQLSAYKHFEEQIKTLPL
ncbi:MAG: hypothetical protein KIS94_13085 [Chitinophagales bacterium]|nr:hypothetical protein [Chitinophagales bacterium]